MQRRNESATHKLADCNDFVFLWEGNDRFESPIIPLSGLGADGHILDVCNPVARSDAIRTLAARALGVRGAALYH